MQVGQLIDLLEPFRGRGDEVEVENDDGYTYRILDVYWDNNSMAVIVKTEWEG